jgi:hypothetical protein
MSGQRIASATDVAIYRARNTRRERKEEAHGRTTQDTSGQGGEQAGERGLRELALRLAAAPSLFVAVKLSLGELTLIDGAGATT